MFIIITTIFKCSNLFSVSGFLHTVSFEKYRLLELLVIGLETNTRRVCTRNLSSGAFDHVCVMYLFSVSHVPVSYVDAFLTSATFCMPWSMAFNASGSLFVVDSNGHHVRRVSPSGCA
jgi:hypothetical protein